MELQTQSFYECPENKDYPVTFRNDTTWGFEFEKVDYPYFQCLGSRLFFLVPVIGVIYVGAIYFAQKYMENRKAYEVRSALVKWNIFLSIFSFLCVARTLPDFIYHLQNYGVHSTLCERLPVNEFGLLWKTLFVVSKVFELVDTAFLILMKKPVLFIHWFHHFSIMMSSFYVGPRAEMIPTMSLVLNASVHSVMYLYFAFHVAGFRFNRLVAACITTIQLTQFVFIWTGTVYGMILRWWFDYPCDLSDESIKFYLVNFTIYLYLFGSLFYNNYVKKGLKPKSKAN